MLSLKYLLMLIFLVSAVAKLIFFFFIIFFQLRDGKKNGGIGFNTLVGGWNAFGQFYSSQDTGMGSML